MDILQVTNVFKTFKTESHEVPVLRDVTFSIEKGSRCSILGPSGSGKTTLLGLCAGLDRPSRGSILLNGHALHESSEDELAEIRNQEVGFVFQNFQLIPSLSALENVLVPLELRGRSTPQKLAEDLLGRVGLGDRLDHFPVQLSGGEQQRVALARAFINKPSILFADEPTGNLDGETGALVEELLFDLNRESGTTLVLVTHNLDLARKTERIYKIHQGAVEGSDSL
ncbi:MAG: ABC transporter ATP-binding protein [Verrucomicrobia bacterium]|nr:ABC transporter ATP-binding protein [Verrucomicrobiota bacterium]MDA1067461.1 ABC transporter ATP-binding protein [Verrucomicrobiota bacterium]